jgi:hypothetical protein
VTLQRSAKETLTTGNLSTEDVVSTGVILAMADVVSGSDVVSAGFVLAMAEIAAAGAANVVASTGGVAAPADVAASGDPVSTVDGDSMGGGVIANVTGTADSEASS